MAEKLSTFKSENGTGVKARRPLYTPEERIRRDSTYWTFVQGLLAPIQFFIFLGSLYFVLRYLVTGEGLETANESVVVKTLTLYTIMITGCIWEKVVFGRYLFAPSFYWKMFSACWYWPFTRPICTPCTPKNCRVLS
jgi:hypothetical protein